VVKLTFCDEEASSIVPPNNSVIKGPETPEPSEPIIPNINNIFSVCLAK
jgi:hypothetical protein